MRTAAVRPPFSVAGSPSHNALHDHVAKITQKYGIGQRGNSADASDQFCGILGTVTAAMPRSNSASSIPAAVGEPQTIEDRLKRLDELFKKGLITEDEYKKKRAELLSKL